MEFVFILVFWICFEFRASDFGFVKSSNISIVRVVKTPSLVKKVFNGLIWNFPGSANEIFLTFDDGPVPEVTPFVLSILKEYNAKATFFCVGKNVEKYPDIYDKIIMEGHSVGNHTYNHINGWETNTEEYLMDVERAREIIDSDLFRPPYGKIKKNQAKALKDYYKIIMWDVLSYDFDSSVSEEKCLGNVTAKAKEGSIVVFHDSVKAGETMKYSLTCALKYFSDREYIFSAIDPKK